MSQKKEHSAEHKPSATHTSHASAEHPQQAAHAPATPHVLDTLVARVGAAKPDKLAAILDGTSNDDLVAKGAEIATSRLVIDGVRLYQQALDFFAEASPAHRKLLRGVSADLLAVAVHHLDSLRKLEAGVHQKSQGHGARRAATDEEAAQALSIAVSLRDQASRSMKDAGKTGPRVAEVDAAFGAADPPEKLAASLDALAELLGNWQKSKDQCLVARLELANLDGEYASELTAAAFAVRKAAAAAAERSDPKARQAALDREDGVQILLLGQIIRAFESAHDRDVTIPRLVPISTRRLFDRHPAPAKSDEAPGDGGPGGGKAAPAGAGQAPKKG
jgi:hypothetical protein